jgi:DNA processing protein
MFRRRSSQFDPPPPPGGAAAATPLAAEYLRLHLLDGIGALRGRRLLDHFGSVPAALAASAAEFAAVAGISRSAAGALQNTDPAAADRELDEVRKLRGRILCLADAEYPELLRQIPDAPLCLYVLGEIEITKLTCLAVVGSRRCTLYGREQAYCFGMAVARCGMVVTSGLARGVDLRAHEAALDCGGPTIAVLACGLAHLSAHRNADVARQIVERGGALFSEYPVSEQSTPGHFPHRNRLIAGLSAGTLVVEAARHSGALITARLAAEYDREVFAVPGRVDTPTAAGVNGLIQRGEAKLAMSIEDILAELQHVRPQLQHGFEQRGRALMAGVTLEPDETTVLNLLDQDGVALARICDASGLPPEKIARTLVMLQLKGLVEQLPGDRFARLHGESAEC